MEDSLLFKNIEDLTIKRDRLLKKLRKRVDALKGNTDYEKLKLTLKEASRLRKALLRTLSKVKQNSVGEEYRELINTLLEFSLLVTVEEELEVLQEIKQKLNAVATGKNELNFIEQEITSVEDLKERLEEVLDLRSRS